MTSFEALSHVEQCFFINAMEHDILPGMQSDLDEAEQDLPHSRLAEILLGLVDRGWLEVRRYVAWTSPDGRDGCAPGDVIARCELPAMLAEPTTWDYWHHHEDWVGAPIITFTEAGLKVLHGTE